MTRSRKQGWLGNANLPWIKETIAPAFTDYFPTIVAALDISAQAREYQGASRLQAGAGAVLEWRLPTVEPGFIEIYDQLDVFSAGGGAAASLRAFVQMHGIDGSDRSVLFSRLSISAGQQISFLSVAGDIRPEAAPGRRVEIPAGGHLLVDTTATIAVNTDLRVSFLRYRIPGPPAFASIEDVTDTITT